MRRFVTLALFAGTALGLAALGTGCAPVTAQPLSGDAKALQGVWAVETLEDGKTEKLTGDARAAALDRIKDVRLVFVGDQLTIADRGEDEPVTFRLDPARSPKVLTLYPERQDPVYRTGPRADSGRSGGGWGRSYAATRPYAMTKRAYETAKGTAPFTATAKGFGTAPAPGGGSGEWNWIYKLDGDTLTVAFSKDDRRSAPADFRPRGDYPAVTVLTLKRVPTPDPDKKPE